MDPAPRASPEGQAILVEENTQPSGQPIEEGETPIALDHFGRFLFGFGFAAVLCFGGVFSIRRTTSSRRFAVSSSE